MQIDNPEKSNKRTQARTEKTRQKLLSAATELFAYRGYEGVTIRDIEKSADVHRGLATYHFDDKESLWRAVVDAKFGNMRERIDQRLEILKDLSPQEQLATIVRFYVRYSAQHPETSALVSQEATGDSWRVHYLVDNHIKPACDAMEALTGQILGLSKQGFVHWYYILISACSTIFYFAPECRLLFGTDPKNEDVVEKHAELLVEMLVRNAPDFD
ncbi:MAG: TetR/AcrR family transcriptional regulator [Halieaceae bacterium]|jgi:AcrR family transcriptional regulator|nr:TetR/AcrR family transcriptional regulator [Halieaceae bacterium]